MASLDMTSNGSKGSPGGSSGTKSTSQPPPDFETFYHTVCTDLQNRGEVHSMSKLFSNISTDEDRMRFILEKNFGQSLSNNMGTWGTWKDFNYDHKDRTESQRLRNLGNQVYQKNKLTEALEYYSQSICYAPHPHPPNSFIWHPGIGSGGPNDINEDPNNSGSFNYEELALGFANRSAVLFQMKEYDLCIRDIIRAFDNSYPNNLMYKLFERKARCLKAVKDFPRALEAMKSAEMWMKYSTLSETKSSSFKKEITKQIELLEEKVSNMSVEEFAESAAQKRNLIQPLTEVKLPNWDGAENKELPGVRKDVKLTFSEEKGRNLVASEDIYPGEIVIVESPYSSILLPEYYSSHCQTCFHRVTAPIPCWCCAKVRFCSDECRSEAWERFHKVECQQLNLILNAGVGKNAMLALRILTSSGKIYLEYVINKLREEAEIRKNRPDAQRQVGFNEDDVYDSADYRTIYSLVANSSQRGVGDLFKRSLMAFYLLKVLEMTPFFFNGGSDPRNVKLQDKVVMGAVILRHLQNLPCNAHEISEMELFAPNNGNNNLNSSSARDSTVHEIGAAVFALLSLLNHSCDPNVVRHYYSSSSVVRAIRMIKKGEELQDNYGYHYAVMSKEERQRKLHNQYFFHCQCVACKCSKRQWNVYSSLNTTPNPLVSVQDPKAVMVDYQKSHRAYKKAFDNVLQGQYEEALPILLEHLKFLDKNISRPFREYNDCQEAIKQCYSAMANCYKLKTSSKKENKDIV